nr:titin-like [Maniola hyperantus]
MATISKLRFIVYRCQLNTKEESCCCSCNSDAMFEVMKSLYDCYKKKNCDNCNCILCGHLSREERRLGELRKSEAKLSKKLILKSKASLAMDLEGKSPAEKEKKIKEMAMAGVPLSEGKTKSEKDLIKKVHTELGLPQVPITTVDKKKMSEAYKAGLIKPLEGKTTAEKEKQLTKQAELGIPLPEGRTSSEKDLIEKVKAKTIPKKRVSSAKLRQAKSAGLLTPLEGKSKKQKEKILKGLAMQGIPLPDAKTDSDKRLMNQVRAEIGRPPEPKTPSDKEKYDRAMATGFITPLEGKSSGKKEKILREQAKMGLPLPEGRTPSEKFLIAKVKETAPPVKLIRVPSEKLRKAKEAGLLTPLQGKSKDQKENILKGLAMQGIPLPEAQNASEKKLLDRIRVDVGLPPEPETPTAKEKYDRAMATGLITPLEGKSAAKKEEILQGQAKLGLPLPEGRTSSEKALIAKVKATTKSLAKMPPRRPALPPEKIKKLDIKTAKIMKEKKRPSDECICDLLTPKSERERSRITAIKSYKAPSEKMRKAKAAGTLTPLRGKSKDQKEKILKGLAMQGIPLPKAQSASEQKLMDRIRVNVGLPLEPRTPSAKKKFDKAMAAGLITPLEGKSTGKKEKILRDQAKMGIPLPEGRTSSEKALIAKVQETTKQDKFQRVPSEKLVKAKATGLLTPLQGKSKEQKEKILKGLALQGIPLPEAQTASDKKLMDRVRAEVGLPPVPKTASAKQKYERATTAGLITPLEGKSTGKKEKILRYQASMGLPLPEGRTPSEKALIAKVKETTKPDKFVRVPSEKLSKAKAAGLLTPLQGKTKEEKERILNGLAMQSIPLPEAQTVSDQKLMDRVRAKVGLPPEPKTPSAKEKYNKAIAAGLITPLEGKSAAKKEEILRGQTKLGLPLPRGRTSSEKALIAKVRPTTKVLSETKPKHVALPPERLKKLDIKTAKIMKEKKGPSDECICGLLTPESEREHIGKIAIKSHKVPSEKIRKAKAAGILTPLEGKSKEQKEKIVKGLAIQGMPLPEAKTASEKKLMDRIRAEVGLPSKPKTPSAKGKYDMSKAAGLITPLEGKLSAEIKESTPKEARGKIKKISKKHGVEAASKSAKRIGISKSKVGVIEEFEDITKTTTCDRGCGCDKKKIRFKHSYVKIRVTSPDISSLCPCPEECIPRVKGGVFTDNEGINVTIGRVTGIPSFPSRELPNIKRTIRKSETCPDLIGLTPSTIIEQNDETDDCLFHNSLKIALNDTSPITNASTNFVSDFHKDDTVIYIKSFNSYYKNLHFLENEIKETFYGSSTSSSLGSFYALETDSSLSSTTASESYSVISVSLKETSSCSCIQTDYLTLKYDEIYGINENCCSNLYTRVLSKSISDGSSSLIIIMPTSSGEYDANYSDSFDKIESTIFMQVSENCFNWKRTTPELHSIDQNKGFKLVTKGKHLKDNKMMLIETDSNDNLFVNEKHNTPCCVRQKAEKTQRMFSNDTTEDRPCCCVTSEANRLPSSSSVKGKRLENIVSELAAPIMLKEAVAQGVCHEAYRNVKDDKSSMPRSRVSTNPTPIPLCKTPPCGTGSHRPTENPVSLYNYPCNKSMESYRPADTSCSACVRPKWNDSSEKLKNIKGKSCCPSSNYGKHRYPSQKNGASLKWGQENSNIENGHTQSKKKKYLICECPEEPQLEFQFNIEDWIDEEQIRKMKSDLTQTVSGFKLKMTRRTPEREMGFEEILKFYAEACEQKYKRVEYEKVKPQLKKNDLVDCICPPVEENVELSGASEEPFQGIKFHIGSKGSGSKGLAGILCFQ